MTAFVRFGRKAVALQAAGLVCLIAWPCPAMAVADDASMRVTLVQSDASGCGLDCPRWIALQGKIGPETPARLQQALDHASQGPWPILVDSPGGAVEAAMAIGRLIRAHGLSVAVAGTALATCASQDRACVSRQGSGIVRGGISAAPALCASACVFLLASGVTRVVGPHAMVGVHQIVSRQLVTKVINTFRLMRRMIDGRPVVVSRTLIATRPIASEIRVGKAPEQLYAEAGAFLSRMGIGSAMMPLMRATAPTSIHWMSQNDIAATNIGRDVVSDDALTASLWPAKGPEGVAAATAPPSPQDAAAKPGAWTLGGKATLSFQAGASLAGERTGAVHWILLTMPATAGGRGATAILCTVEVPDARLRLSLQARSSRSDEGGDVALELQFVTDDSVFGPVTSLSVPPVWTSGGHVLLIADQTDRLQSNEYRVGLSLPLEGSVGSEIRMELGDTVGRHATLRLEVPGPVDALIRAVARKVSRVAD